MGELLTLNRNKINGPPNWRTWLKPNEPKENSKEYPKLGPNLAFPLKNLKWKLRKGQEFKAH